LIRYRPEKSIGRARMRYAPKSSLFIPDLTGCGPRRSHPGAIKVVPYISAAAFVDATVSSSHRTLAESICLGETAQSLRSAEGLSRASQNILDLPLGKVAHYVGRYYKGLNLNRQGPEAFAEADKILIDVADHGPPLLRAKALVALATNLRIAGDDKAALEIYREVSRIAESSQQGKWHPIFFAALQSAFIKYDQGDFRGALADIEKLEPLARQVCLEQPAFLHNYYNSLAVSLTANGRVEEASRLSKALLTSPFRSAYPEWQRTYADIALTTQSPSRLSVLIGKPFTGEPEALTASGALGADRYAAEFPQLSVSLADRTVALPESFGKPLDAADHSVPATAVDTRAHLAESVITQPAAPATAFDARAHLIGPVVTHPAALASTVDARPQLARPVITHPGTPATSAGLPPTAAVPAAARGTVSAFEIAATAARVFPSAPTVQTAAHQTARAVEIAGALLPVRAAPVCTLYRRISIGIVSRLLLRRPSTTARNRVLFPRNSGARLRPFRWSYLSSA
jgi:hypothetical protein